MPLQINPKRSFGENLLLKFKDKASNLLSAPFQQAGFNQQQGQPLSPIQNISSGIGKAQDFVESNKSFSPIPYVTPFKANNISSNIGNFAANIPGSVANGVVSPTMNIATDFGSSLGRLIGGREQAKYSDIKSPFMRLAANIAGDHRTTNEVVGNIGGIGADVMSTYIPEGVGALSKDAFSRGLARRVFSSSITPQVVKGAEYTGTQGFLNGLNDNRGKSLPNQFINATLSGLENIPSGAITGGFLANTGYASGKVKANLLRTFKNNFRISSNKADTVISDLTRDELGRFVGKPQTNESTPQGFFNNMLNTYTPTENATSKIYEVGEKYRRPYKGITPEMRMAFRISK